MFIDVTDKVRGGSITIYIKDRYVVTELRSLSKPKQFEFLSIEAAVINSCELSCDRML